MENYVDSNSALVNVKIIVKNYIQRLYNKDM